MFLQSNSANEEYQQPAADMIPTPPPHKSPTQPESTTLLAAEAESYKAAGNKYFKAGDFQKAISEYTQAIQADSNNSTYLSNRSAAYMGLNFYDKALEDARQADILEPGNSKVMLRLARIYTALGRPAEALSIYARIEPDVAAKDTMPASVMQRYVEQAANALEQGAAASMVLHALDQAEKGLGTGVEKPRAWRLLRGEAYLKMRNTRALADAQNVAMSLLRSNNQDPDALVLRGRIMYAQGENDKAIQHFRQALGFDPDLKLALRYLRLVQQLERVKEEGNRAFKAGRYQEAVSLYGSALEVDPANRGTNSKILQNRALASIKVCCSTVLRKSSQGLLISFSSRNTVVPLMIAPRPWSLIPRTSKLGEQRLVRLENQVTGKQLLKNTKPLQKTIPQNLALQKTFTTQSWSSKNQSEKTITRFWASRRMRVRARLRKHTEN